MSTIVSTIQTCHGPFDGALSTCNCWPTEGCFFRCCSACCKARGGWSFLGCKNPLHRIFINNAPCFRPNLRIRSPTIAKPYILPIASPRSGDFSRPAGFVTQDCISDGWEDGQLTLRSEAIARYPTEGITMYLFSWAEVRASRQD